MKNLSVLTTAETTTPRENTILFYIIFIELPGQHDHDDFLFKMLTVFLLFTDCSVNLHYPTAVSPLSFLCSFPGLLLPTNTYKPICTEHMKEKLKHLISIAFCKFNLTTIFLTLFTICILSVHLTAKQLGFFNEVIRTETKYFYNYKRSDHIYS